MQAGKILLLQSGEFFNKIQAFHQAQPCLPGSHIQKFPSHYSHGRLLYALQFQPEIPYFPADIAYHIPCDEIYAQFPEAPGIFGRIGKYSSLLPAFLIFSRFSIA